MIFTLIIISLQFHSISLTNSVFLPKKKEPLQHFLFYHKLLIKSSLFFYFLLNFMYFYNFCMYFFCFYCTIHRVYPLYPHFYPPAHTLFFPFFSLLFVLSTFFIIYPQNIFTFTPLILFYTSVSFFISYYNIYSLSVFYP